jgi:predicted membrane-bound spermidine synthase
MQPRDKGNGFLLGVTVFLSAAAALAVEIIAVRIMAPVVGMSLYTWTAIIAVVLAGLSIGHWAAGRLYEDTEVPGRGDAVIAGSLALAGLATIGAAYLRLLALDVVDSLGGVGIPSIIALSILLFFAPSFFVGIVAPAATTLALADEAVDRGRTIGRMFALGAAGSILGTMAAGFILLSWVGSARSLLLVGAVHGVLAAVHWLHRFRAHGQKP